MQVFTKIFSVVAELFNADRRTDMTKLIVAFRHFVKAPKKPTQITLHTAVAYPGIFFGRGGSTNSVEDRGQRERGSGGGSPLVRGSGGNCNLVQEISFHIVKFS